MVVECEPDVDKMLKVEEVGVVSERREKTKRGKEEDDTTEDLGCEDAESNEDSEDISQEEQKTEQTEEDNKPRKFLKPGVFDEIPVVGGRCCGCKNKFDTIRAPPRECTDKHLYGHQSRMLKATKNHMCVECGLRFKHPGLLRDHEITHTGERAFKCSECPATYNSKESYRKHIKLHSDPANKYKCDICGCSYRHAKGLKEHITAEHTGERPHKCSHCPARHARTSGLSSHLLSHSVQKLHRCPKGKEFKRFSECKQHVNFFHHKLKPFPCFFCPRQYPRKDYRKRHMVSAHAEELRNNPLPPVELFGNPRWNELKANAVPPVQTLSSI
ncbi:zinc finger protein 99-like [Armigeres subalbatus]|uniref:zinc finger protein 99-like n=1 Tax=Armigeres subalbatus TaxID=124917 RepID=UPI002ED03922